MLNNKQISTTMLSIESHWSELDNTGVIKYIDSIISDPATLKTISLMGNKITDLSIFAKYVNLKKLYLQNNCITDSSEFIPMPHLTKLSLSDSEITNIHWISNFPKLEVLYLTGTNVSDIAGIDKAYYLKKITLASTKITNSSIDELLKLYYKQESLKIPIFKEVYLQNSHHISDQDILRLGVLPPTTNIHWDDEGIMWTLGMMQGDNAYKVK